LFLYSPDKKYLTKSSLLSGTLAQVGQVVGLSQP
jgi:hypothetical protein